jgi:hypothetical protein
MKVIVAGFELHIHKDQYATRQAHCNSQNVDDRNKPMPGEISNRYFEVAAAHDTRLWIVDCGLWIVDFLIFTF